MKKNTIVGSGERRSIWIPTPLWQQVKQAALRAGIASGEAVTASEWLREALREKLAREEH